MRNNLFHCHRLRSSSAPFIQILQECGSHQRMVSNTSGVRVHLKGEHWTRPLSGRVANAPAAMGGPRQGALKANEDESLIISQKEAFSPFFLPRALTLAGSETWQEADGAPVLRMIVNTIPSTIAKTCWTQHQGTSAPRPGVSSHPEWVRAQLGMTATVTIQERTNMGTVPGSEVWRVGSVSSAIAPQGSSQAVALVCCHCEAAHPWEAKKSSLVLRSSWEERGRAPKRCAEPMNRSNSKQHSIPKPSSKHQGS